MRADGLLGGLAFAALAGLVWLAWLIALGPVLGAGSAVTLFLLFVVPVYLWWISPSHSSGLRAALLAFSLLLVTFALLTALGTGLLSHILATAGCLAVVRSGFVRRRRPGRALLLETALAGVGLLFGHLLGSSWLIGGALALWGFFLVQTLFGLIGGEAPADGPAEIDPFVRARKSALAVLDQTG